MKLWLLRPVDDGAGAWDPWYDKTFGFVVEAPDEHTARQLADANGGAENSSGPRYSKAAPWLDPEQSTCVELKPRGTPGVILADTRMA